MTARILDGRAVAAEIKADLCRLVVAALHRRWANVPGLGTLLVGDDPGSRAYVAGKHRDCAEVGIHSIQRELPATASQQQVEDVVARAQRGPDLHRLHRPAAAARRPRRRRAVLELMDPAKDADGLHPMNLGRLVLGQPAPLPCTPRGIVELLRRYDVRIDGAEVVRRRPRRHRRPAAGAAADPPQRRTPP